MSIWFREYPLDVINKNGRNSMVEHCGIEITDISDNALTGTMPADDRNKQPFGILHGGANCVLAETLGSVAANLVCDPAKAHAVGLSINTNHVRAVRNGLVKGVARPVHIGSSSQVWEINTYNDQDQLTSKTSLTMAVVSRRVK